MMCMLIIFFFFFCYVCYPSVKDKVETLVLHERVENIIWNRLKDYNKFHAYGMAY